METVMRVALFFDGKNFYESLERAHEGSHHLNYGLLASWLVERVKGTQLTGAHYYTGIPDRLDPESPEYPQLRGLMRFLDSLEYVEGFFVYRFPRMRRMTRCSACGVSTSYTEEKEVDTSMVADMIRLAAGDAFDVLVLASGDADHSPAVEAVRAMGKVVYLASWGDEALSPRLRRAAYGNIDLLHECPPDILGEQIRAALDGGGKALAAGEKRPEITLDPEIAERVLSEVTRAQIYFEEHGGYLGRGYFIHRWRGHEIPAEEELRELYLDQLVEEDKLEEVQILGETALKAAGVNSPMEPETQPKRSDGDSPVSQNTTHNDTLPYIPTITGEVPLGSHVSKTVEMRRPIMESLHPTLEQHVFNDPELTAAWDSLRRAEVHFRYRGFVGRGYYLTKWRDLFMQ